MYHFIHTVLKRFGSGLEAQKSSTEETGLFRQPRLQTDGNLSTSKSQGAVRGKLGQFLLVVLLVAATAGLSTLSSCDLMGSKSGESLYGTWKAVGTEWIDGYTIWYDGSKEKAYIKYLSMYPEISDFGFIGEIQPNSTGFKETTGYIYFKVLERGMFSFLEIGKYSAVHWENFTGDTIKMGTAYINEGNNNAGLPTVQEAIQEYTIENGYFVLHGEYQRQ
ncbi:MAG: hypothetical protein SNJ78_11520 [Spirochaetales bacterium]